MPEPTLAQMRAWRSPISASVRFTVADPRVEPEPNTGCWLWTGSTDGAGYGTAKARVDGRVRFCRAHRLVWERLIGPIPVGLYLDHVCRVRSCVNPAHLRAVTPRQNTLENSTGPTAQNAARTHCPKCGGPYQTYTRRRGARLRRDCRTCRAQYGRDWRARRLASSPRTPEPK